MTNRAKFWLGVSTLALLSGTLPIAPTAMVPMPGAALLTAEAQAQESEEGEGAAAECGTEDGEGEEGGESECAPPEGEGEDGEGG